MLHITSCEYADPSDAHSIIGCPVGTRLHRIVRVCHDIWLLWTATNDYRLGTYFLLHHDGLVERVTARADEGDEIFTVRPSDRDIQRHEDTK